MPSAVRALFRPIFLVCFCVVARPVQASTVIYRTDSQLVALSERVVHGRVIDQRTARAGSQGRIYTVTTLRVIEDLTGLSGDTVEIWELGGRVGDEFLFVGGAVEYRPGAEILVCLERGPFGLRSVAMGLSKFDVLPEINGERSLQRDLRDTLVVGGLVTREPTLSEMRALAVQVTGRQPRPGRPLQPGEELASIVGRFTKLGGEPGWRWAQADSGTAVTWYMNTSAPNPLLSGDAVIEVQTALAAWTNPASASIVLQYGGTTNQGSATGPWSGLPGGSGLITFEDPDNQISGSTLAIGGGSGFGGTGGTVNGTTYNGFSRGYVIFQNAADLGTSFRQSLNFMRVLTHEIGHGIGLGHTQTNGTIPNATSNIMYPSCCSSSTPIPPALGPDDLDGLNVIYPAASVPCTYSINPAGASAPAAGGTWSVSVTTQPGCSWTAASNAAFLGISSRNTGDGSGSVTYNVASNSATNPRSGTLTIAGSTFTVNQAAAVICTYSVTPGATSFGAAGGNGTATIDTQSGCPWTAVSGDAFLSITSAASGTGSASVSYNVSSNGMSARTGSLTIASQTLAIAQLGTGPTATLDKQSLQYGATLSGSVVTAQTTSQTIRLNQSAGAALTWTAAASHPWLVVNPASGTGAAELSVTVNPAGLSAPSTLNASITLTFGNAGNFVSPVPVTLSLMTTGTSSNPFGLIDTPVDHAGGVVGAIPVTGWALDDVEVSNLFVCRRPVAGESPAPDARCSGAAEIFLGEAVFIDGARPDIRTAFPALPRESRGGWGFMVLTNMLPGQGNGTYTLALHARDREAHSVLLGTRTFTCNNGLSTRPFGTIDTPAQGGVASGASYVNFGWALTPSPKSIPADGSTITVFIDGAPVGHPSYNNFRADIAALFPGLSNTGGAIGYQVIDTTAFANGLHTIAWTVTDSAGATEGIGSRYFRVSNTTGTATAASVESISAGAGIDLLPLDRSPVAGRVGWDLQSPWRAYEAGAAGRVVIRAEEVGLLELRFAARPDVRFEGYLRSGGTLAPLPVGARLDGSSGRFTWQPGVGFVGAYDFVFVRRDGGDAVSRREIRVILHAKGSGFVGSQIVIDTPAWQSDVAQPFMLAGWAADLQAPEDTGIGAVHAWAYPLSGGAPVFLGSATVGYARPDVAAVHGEQFRDSGYGMLVQGLAPGHYDVAVFAWSEFGADFLPAKVVRVTVR